MRPQPLAACLALVVFLPFGGASATPSVPPAAPATPAPTAAAAPRSAHRQPVQRPLAGLYLSGCHGVTGYKNAYPSYRVPKIGGQSSQYLTQALTEYRQGKRKHPTMQAQAQSFSEQDIADISAYLSTLK